MSEQQPSLFETAPEPWELDAQASHLVATIVFSEKPVGEYDYLVPDNFISNKRPRSGIASEHELKLGCRVEVMFGRGNRRRVGYCVRLETKQIDARRLKTIVRVIDDRSLLTPSMLKLTRWIADYYLCDWGQVLNAVLPGGVRKQAGTRQAVLLHVTDEVLAKLSDLKLSPKRRQILDCLAASKHPITSAQLSELAECTNSPILALRKLGLISERKTRISTYQSISVQSVVRQNPLVLNARQQTALDAIKVALNSGNHQPILLHGVTGSGKTEVYIQAIEETVRFGRQAIVLVPEISLTPQTEARFRARFESVAVLHSHQSPAERHWQWRQIAEGDVQVIVGARSAIFAPTPHLGLIVIDEEHENTFKQDIVPRYEAQTVALKRAELEGIPLVCGSATPSLLSWQRAQTGEYQLLSMPDRIHNRPMPDVRIVDLRDERRDRPFRGSLGHLMQQGMKEALHRGGKVILLLNRRGFSTHLQCPACGEVVVCPGCEIPLTFHRQINTVVCHYCEHTRPAPVKCPACDFSGIRYSGTGTQRLEAEVKARFPDVPCIRMDTDAMSKPGSHAQALDAFRAGKASILLGTQMIAKGLDIPEVTLVGVVNADSALHFQDYRAAERTFQLITQVAGRTGRGKAGGRVIVQTLSPDHPAIRAAARHDYLAFVGTELPHRKMLGYPPFGAMIRFVMRSTDLAKLELYAKSLAERLQEELATFPTTQEGRYSVLGPAHPPIAKLRGFHRLQILLRGPCLDSLRSAAHIASAAVATPDGVQWIIDVDPVNMM